MERGRKVVPAGPGNKTEKGGLELLIVSCTTTYTSYTHRLDWGELLCLHFQSILNVCWPNNPKNNDNNKKIIIIKILFYCNNLDQVGIPDYSSGATEHWGIITYRDTRLLYDPEQVSDYDKQRVLSIIAHELAHNVSDIYPIKLS